MAEKIYEEQLRANAMAGAVYIADVLAKKAPMTDLAKLAMAAINQDNKFQGTKGVFASLAFGVAKATAKDREELKKLIKADQKKIGT